MTVTALESTSCRSSRGGSVGSWIAAVALLWGHLGAVAQTAGKPLVHATTAPPVAQPQAARPPKSSASDWERLNASEKQALAPLAGSWAGLSATQKRKWLEVSRNYAALPAPDQAKMHDRMRDWVALSPQERAQARLNFAKTAEVARELSAAEKLAKWQAYQALSPEQKQKLAEQAKGRSQGAATAVQPVPTQKLAVLPPINTARVSKGAENQEEPTESSDAPSNQ